MAEPKRIDIKEFRDEGYLQEVNRRFFHPLGLALEIVIEDCHHPRVEAGSFPADRCEDCDEDGKLYRLGGVWDERDDPEGIHFGGELDAEKCLHILDLQNERRDPRQDALGWWIEPIPSG